MPVEFLSDEDLALFGQFPGPDLDAETAHSGSFDCSTRSAAHASSTSGPTSVLLWVSVTGRSSPGHCGWVPLQLVPKFVPWGLLAQGGALQVGHAVNSGSDFGGKVLHPDIERSRAVGLGYKLEKLVGRGDRRTGAPGRLRRRGRFRGR